MRQELFENRRTSRLSVELYGNRFAIAAKAPLPGNIPKVFIMDIEKVTEGIFQPTQQLIEPFQGQVPKIAQGRMKVDRVGANDNWLSGLDASLGGLKGPFYRKIFRIDGRLKRYIPVQVEQPVATDERRNVQTRPVLHHFYSSLPPSPERRSIGPISRRAG